MLPPAPRNCLELSYFGKPPPFGDDIISERSLLQNKAAQIVSHFPPRTSRTELYDKVQWLTVNQLILYHTLLTIFKVRKNNEPECLASKLKNDTRTGHILIPNMKLGLAQNAFTIRGSASWNYLPENIRNQLKIGAFKKLTKLWIADNIPRFLD